MENAKKKINGMINPPITIKILLSLVPFSATTAVIIIKINNEAINIKGINMVKIVAPKNPPNGIKPSAKIDAKIKGRTIKTKLRRIEDAIKDIMKYFNFWFIRYIQKIDNINLLFSCCTLEI